MEGADVQFKPVVFIDFAVAEAMMGGSKNTRPDANWNARKFEKQMFKPLSLSLRMLRAHRACNAVSEVLFYGMVVFSPWAFGTTDAWAIGVMNAAGYLAGSLLLVKLAIRFSTGYRNARWGERGSEIQTGAGDSSSAQHFLTKSLAILTAAIVGYCLVSALNARYNYDRPGAFLENARHSVSWLPVSWLPHSYDQTRSWAFFWNYLALALSFWAVWDWIMGKTSVEEQAERGQLDDPKGRRASLLPERLRRLLWVLSVNGGIMGVEAIAQRMDGTAKLLFFAPAYFNRAAISHFGPYEYRSNAAQYFGLLWPVALGLWWSLERAARRGLRDRKEFGLRGRHLILGCALVMAACPFFSLSRVGTVVTAANLAVAAGALWSAQHKEDRKTKAGIAIGVALVLGCSAWVIWGQLGPRFEKEALDEGWQIRSSSYEIARPMTEACPLFGTGPGTFEPLFQMYRPDPGENWWAQLHDDWLETLITFGWLGTTLILLALFTVLSHWFLAGGIHGSLPLMVLFWAALAGCLFYARYDFPFQIYSVLFLFLVLCAGLFTLSHRR
jgi:hypothetical protein